MNARQKKKPKKPAPAGPPKRFGLALCIDPQGPVITLHNEWGEVIGGWRTEEAAIPAAEALKATGIKFDISPAEGAPRAAARAWWRLIKVITPVGFE